MPYEVGQDLQHLRLYVPRYPCAAQLEAVQIHRHVCDWYTPPTASAACRAEPAILTFSPRNSPPAQGLSAAMFLTSW